MAQTRGIAAPAQSVFDTAVKDFQDELADRDEVNFRGIETIDDVYDEIRIIQEEQGRKGKLRFMKRIEPFLACLEQYSDVLDTFVQAKASVLALIWVGGIAWDLIGHSTLKFSRGHLNFFFEYDSGPTVD